METSELIELIDNTLAEVAVEVRVSRQEATASAVDRLFNNEPIDNDVADWFFGGWSADSDEEWEYQLENPSEARDAGVLLDASVLTDTGNPIEWYVQDDEGYSFGPGQFVVDTVVFDNITADWQTLVNDVGRVTYSLNGEYGSSEPMITRIVTFDNPE